LCYIEKWYFLLKFTKYISLSPTEIYARSLLAKSETQSAADVTDWRICICWLYSTFACKKLRSGFMQDMYHYNFFTLSRMQLFCYTKFICQVYRLVVQFRHTVCKKKQWNMCITAVVWCAAPAETQVYDIGSNPAPWTAEEQKLLEQAMRTYPGTDSDRWDKIAECIPCRSKKDCMKRYKVCIRITV